MSTRIASSRWLQLAVALLTGTAATAPFALAGHPEVGPVAFAAAAIAFAAGPRRRTCAAAPERS